MHRKPPDVRWCNRWMFSEFSWHSEVEPVTSHSDTTRFLLSWCLSEDYLTLRFCSAWAWRSTCLWTSAFRLQQNSTTLSQSLFLRSHLLISMVSARPGQTGVSQNLSSVVLALFWVTLDDTKSAWTCRLTVFESHISIQCVCRLKQHVRILIIAGSEPRSGSSRLTWLCISVL